MARRARRHSRALPTESVRLKIDRLSHEGRGVGNINGKIAFVEGALPGETVEAVYTSNRSKFAELTTLAVIDPHSQRVPPSCEYFGTCGGCSLQHFDSVAQLTFKQQMLVEQLCQATGQNKEGIPLLEQIRGPAYHYRRKARLAVRHVAKKGGTLVGFRERHSSFITVMDDCQVLEPPLARLIKPLKLLIDDFDARASIPQIEVAAGDRADGSIQVALVLRHLDPLGENDLARIRQFAERHDCDLYLQPGDESTIHKLWPADGVEKLQYLLPESDLTMQFHPVDFVQVNAGINRQAIARAIALLDLKPSDRVLDLFCGLGNFTLPMAGHCEYVAGVEGSDTLVGRAAANASLNQVDNVEFFVSDLYGNLDSAAWLRGHYHKVLLDPPRSGALEVIALLPSLQPGRIVYVSCNPATLARDAAVLVDRGYRLTGAGVMDMFPQTTHVESIALFERHGTD